MIDVDVFVLPDVLFKVLNGTQLCRLRTLTLLLLLLLLLQCLLLFPIFLVFVRGQISQRCRVVRHGRRPVRLALAVGQLPHALATWAWVQGVKDTHLYHNTARWRPQRPRGVAGGEQLGLVHLGADADAAVHLSQAAVDLRVLLGGVQRAHGVVIARDGGERGIRVGGFDETSVLW